MHLITEEPAASRMLEPFGEVGGDVPEYISSRTHFAKIEDKRTISVGPCVEIWAPVCTFW